MNLSAIIGALVGFIIWSFAVYTYATGHESRKWELASAEALIAAKDKAAANQKKLDDDSYAADRAFWEANPKIVTNTQTVIKWATKHVTDIAGCPTAELVSVYNSSITGTGAPSEAESPAGTPSGAVPAKNGS